MAITTIELRPDEVLALLAKPESHFLDMKAKEIAPAKLTKSMSAFANADGGELFIGIAQRGTGFAWDGFPSAESANGYLQPFELLFPLGQAFTYEFLSALGETGLILHATILKTREIRYATDGVPYLRRGAQNLPVTGPAALEALKRAKGLITHEDATLAASEELITNSTKTLEFMLAVIPHSEPEVWLKKQQLVLEGRPTVAGTMLFAEEPQVLLPKGAVKIYRYKTSNTEGTRETLAFDPVTIDGPIYDQVRGAVTKTVELTEQIRIMTEDGLQPIKYPHESLHEIITNAVLHRDYALNDDVHVRIFDNRVEVESPGRLPAHITPANILSERFARNPKIVRLVNKFPNPPNKDVGEGLNTAFQAMKRLRLREPQIIERDNSVLVLIRHERLASPEQTIVAYLHQQGTITNAKAREITGIASEVQVRAIFKRLLEANEIEQVPGTFKATTAYRLATRRRGTSSTST